LYRPWRKEAARGTPNALKLLWKPASESRRPDDEAATEAALRKANPFHYGIADFSRIAGAISADLDDLARNEVAKRIIAIYQVQQPQCPIESPTQNVVLIRS
jgi:hypothetical protein